MNGVFIDLRTLTLASLLLSVCLRPQAAEPLALTNMPSADNQTVLAPEQPYAGKSQLQWAERWWQWASSMRDDQSPLRDVTGRLCAVNQDGDVWFIAGALGGGKVSRRCTIPAGKAVFLPLITTMFQGDGDCRKAVANAAATSDHLAYASFELDGVASNNLTRYRQASKGCFALHPDIDTSPNATDNGNGNGGGSDSIKAATDGYWILLQPLSPGEHLLKFTAAYDKPDENYGQMKQDITYRLTVLAP